MPDGPIAAVELTYVGGPTALLRWCGLGLLTDPTFDPAGTSYELAGYSLHKEQSPAIGVDALGPIDGVLLSHDHHVDNLDHTGRRLLERVRLTLTTVEGAERLGGTAVGLEPWSQIELDLPDGTGGLLVTATPARHGPEHGDRGPVIGFVLACSDEPEETIYLSGDTVWYAGVREVARRFSPRLAILNLGAATVSVAGEEPLTFTAAEAVEVAEAMPRALIVPLHFEGWRHFQEGRSNIERGFAAAGLEQRLLWPTPGRATAVDLRTARP